MGSSTGSRLQAQSISLIPTVFNGTPFKGSDVLTRLTTGEKISLNVVLDTRDTDIYTDAITVNIRFQRNVLSKLIRREFEGPNTGWPIQDGAPILTSKMDLPATLQEHVGIPFFTVTGSTDNPECPCDEANGAGKEAVTHFILVDVQRGTFLPPGLYHLFQTDWIVTQDCSIENLQFEITDGPSKGLRGLGTPSKNFLYDDITEIVYEIDQGLNTSAPPQLDLNCRQLLKFLRGDTNHDGRADISDTINILSHLFLGKEILCAAAGDVDDNGELELTDAIFLIRYLFLSGEGIPAPFPNCGTALRKNEFLCRLTCS